MWMFPSLPKSAITDALGKAGGNVHHALDALLMAKVIPGRIMPSSALKMQWGLRLRHDCVSCPGSSSEKCASAGRARAECTCWNRWDRALEDQPAAGQTTFPPSSASLHSKTSSAPTRRCIIERRKVEQLRSPRRTERDKIAADAKPPRALFSQTQPTYTQAYKLASIGQHLHTRACSGCGGSQEG